MLSPRGDAAWSLSTGLSISPTFRGTIQEQQLSPDKHLPGGGTQKPRARAGAGRLQSGWDAEAASG